MFTKFVEEQNKNNSFLPQIQFAAIDLVSSFPLRNTQNITGFKKTNKTVEYDGSFRRLIEKMADQTDNLKKTRL